jgi:ubiquinone/menaquinone biosynthesis C-methylase UbiE
VSSRRGTAPKHVARNREFWDADSAAYQAAHGDDLASRPLAWGAWRRPEAELNMLADVTGRDLLELGCGGAQWSAALASAGARCVGIDLSIAQLGHARIHCREAGVTVPLALTDAERLPFRADSFDLVFCDHGAMSFCDPELTLPEVARVLRRGGMLVFCATHPLVYLTWNNATDKQTRTLHMDYAELGCVDLGEGTVDWVLPPGTWIDRFHTFGFDVTDLIELVAPASATTTYDEFVPTKWAQRWPAEQIWRVRLR